MPPLRARFGSGTAQPGIGKPVANVLTISAHQQQRVAIARALVNDPVLILADEPTGALDSRTSFEVMGLLQQLNRGGMTVVLVTHEREIAAFASRMVSFRDGHVVSDEQIARPADAQAMLRALEVEAVA